MLIVVERDERGGFQRVVNAMVDKVNGAVGEKPNGSGSSRSTKLMDAAWALANGSGDVRAILVKEFDGEMAATIGKKLKDDIFPPQLAEIRLRSATSRIGTAGNTSRIKTVRTEAHGGRYEIQYSWRVE